MNQTCDCLAHWKECNCPHSVSGNVGIREIKLRDTVGLTMSLPLTINGTEVSAVVDTAAQVTMISQSFCNSLEPPLTASEKIKINNAQKDSSMEGWIARDVEIGLGGSTYTWDVVVAPITDDCILGFDFMKSNHCQLDLGNNLIRIGEQIHSASLRRDPSGSEYRVSRVTLDETVVIPPYSSKMVTGKLLHPTERDVVLQPSCRCHGVMMSATVVNGNKPTPVQVINDTQQPVALPRGHFIGNAVELDSVLELDEGDEAGLISDETEENPQSLDNQPHPHLARCADTSMAESTSKGKAISPQRARRKARYYARYAATSKANPVPAPASGLVAPLRVPEHLAGLLQKSSTDLNSSQREKVAELLIEFQDIFSRHDLDLGHFTGLTHKIDTGNARPIKCRMRRTPLGFEKEEEKTIQGMLDAGVIQESTSEWASVPVLVRKRDGSVRYCVDFRGINSLSVKDSYPLPLIEECLDTLSGVQYFNCLDMAAGYWQISIAPEDRHKTAFVTKYGLYEHVRMGFGLCNAPATFQRAVNLVLRGLTWKSVLAYLDDVIVVGKDFQDALANLREVFLRFRKYNLKLKPRKCALFQSEVGFLGKKVDRFGVRVTKDKIQAVLDWPVPTNRTEVESFLGYVNYHRDYLKGFAGIASCLYGLTGPKAVFNWQAEHQRAFEQLKSMMTAPPVLAFPQAEGRFILDTDASDLAIGAELSQIQDGVERCIAYSSYTLTPEQRRYCTTRKELLAVVAFTRHFRHYLLGRQFTVRTDHSSLVWLTRFRHIGGQLARWLEELSQFDFEIQHRSGIKHSNADGLSRIPERDNPCPCYTAGKDIQTLPCGGCKYCEKMQQQWTRFESDVDDVVPLAVRQITAEAEAVEDPAPPDTGSNYMDTYSPEQLRDFQLKDSDLKPLLTWLEAKYEPTQAELFLQSRATRHMWLCKPQLKVVGGVLYYLWDYGTHTKLKLVVPENLKEDVLSMVHDTKAGGHFGRDITTQKLKHSFYWFQCARDCKVFVETCAVCSKQKKPTVRARAGLHNYRAGAPGDRVHLDILGPFVTSSQGNRYVLVAIDQFSKWVELRALPEQTAEAIAKSFFEDWVVRFGTPTQIHTDQGKNFDGNLFKSFCKLLEIAKTRTTPYRPSSNGQVERYNRVIVQFIRCFLEGKQKNWDLYLPALGMSLRASVNRSTGFTANLLHLGREVHMPSDVFLGLSEVNQPDLEHAAYVKNILSMSKETLAKAREGLRATQVRQKRTYDEKLHQHSYQKGDMVYKIDSSTKVGHSKKLRPVWLGPFLVTEVLSPVLYRIQGRKDTTVIHHDRLKICKDRVIPLWLRRKRHGLLDLDETIGYAMDELDSILESSSQPEGEGAEAAAPAEHPSGNAAVPAILPPTPIPTPAVPAQTPAEPAQTPTVPEQTPSVTVPTPPDHLIIPAQVPAPIQYDTDLAATQPAEYDTDLAPTQPAEYGNDLAETQTAGITPAEVLNPFDERPQSDVLTDSHLEQQPLPQIDLPVKTRRGREVKRPSRFM